MLCVCLCVSSFYIYFMCFFVFYARPKQCRIMYGILLLTAVMIVESILGFLCVCVFMRTLCVFQRYVIYSDIYVVFCLNIECCDGLRVIIVHRMTGIQRQSKHKSAQPKKPFIDFGFLIPNRERKTHSTTTFKNKIKNNKRNDLENITQLWVDLMNTNTNCCFCFSCWVATSAVFFS